MTSSKTELLASAAAVETAPSAPVITPAEDFAPKGFKGDKTPEAPEPECATPPSSSSKTKKKKARAPPELPDRIISEPECEQITGLSRTTRWRGMKAGWFPSCVELSPGRKGWWISELLVWKESRKKTYAPEETA